jgi:hypothetical protein
MSARAIWMLPAAALLCTVSQASRGSGDPSALPTETPLDVVRLRLLRYEARRWQIEAAAQNKGQNLLRNDVLDEATPEPAPIIPAQDSFDDWAFGGKAGEQRFRNQLDKLLRRKVNEVEQFFQLTEAQRRKLTLAGRGDIQRLLEMVEDARKEFQLARTNVRRLAELQKDLRLVELRVSDGLFEMGSLFAKTLRKMVDEKQLVRRSANPKR